MKSSDPDPRARAGARRRRAAAGFRLRHPARGRRPGGVLPGRGAARGVRRRRACRPWRRARLQRRGRGGPARVAAARHDEQDRAAAGEGGALPAPHRRARGDRRPRPAGREVGQPHDRRTFAPATASRRAGRSSWATSPTRAALDAPLRAVVLELPAERRQRDDPRDARGKRRSAAMDDARFRRERPQARRGRRAPRAAAHRVPGAQGEVPAPHVAGARRPRSSSPVSRSSRARRSSKHRASGRRFPAIAVKDKPGEFEFDLGGQLPVDRLRVALPQPNTVAVIEILARAKVADPWRHGDENDGVSVEPRGRGAEEPRHRDRRRGRPVLAGEDRPARRRNRRRTAGARRGLGAARASFSPRAAMRRSSWRTAAGTRSPPPTPSRPSFPATRTKPASISNRRSRGRSPRRSRSAPRKRRPRNSSAAQPRRASGSTGSAGRSGAAWCSAWRCSA